MNKQEKNNHTITMSDIAWKKLVLIAKYNGLSVSSYLENFARNKKINM